jgi:hypothetical protein
MSGGGEVGSQRCGAIPTVTVMFFYLILCSILTLFFQLFVSFMILCIYIFCIINAINHRG